MHKDISTSVVKVRRSKKYNVAPVKSNKPVRVSKWIDFSNVLGRLYVGVPTKSRNVVCKDIMNTGVDIICTKNPPKDS